MNRKWYIGLVLLSLTVLSACSSYRYYKAGDSFISLNKYRTFAWAQNLPNRKPDSIVNDQKGLGARLNYLNNNRYFKSPEAARTIKSATVTILQSKGLTLQENNADLLVRYTTLVDRGTRNAYYGGYYPYYGGFYGGWGWGGWGWGGWGWRRPWFGYGGWGGWGYGYGGGYPVKEHFKEGVLAIELIDSRTRETVWIGYGAGELSRNPEKVIAQLPKVVDGIFKQLPVSH